MTCSSSLPVGALPGFRPPSPGRSTRPQSDGSSRVLPIREIRNKRLLAPMKLVVVGPGVIGSIYAGRLAQSGHEVTLLARGQRLADLRAHGLVLEDAASGRRT